jgi:nucleoside-diphosphate-sugar epimerase
MKDVSHEPLEEFRKVNLYGTLNLARQCVNAGVKRFIYLSSIGVNGLRTRPHSLFAEVDAPNPHNAYALSKYEAEIGLMEIAKESKLEVVIIRPPLIYGPDAPGNFGMLLRLVQKGIPLPFLGVRNKRSFIALDNLIDFILLCLTHPMAKNEIFLVSDDHDISTPDLVKYIAEAAKLPNRSIYLPIWALCLLMKLGGLGDRVPGLIGSLRINITKAKNLLGWIPPFSIKQSIDKAIK